MNELLSFLLLATGLYLTVRCILELKNSLYLQTDLFISNDCILPQPIESEIQVEPTIIYSYNRNDEAPEITVTSSYKPIPTNYKSQRVKKHNRLRFSKNAKLKRRKHA